MQFLFGGRAHCLHLSGELDGLSGQRMVEIHLHLLWAYLKHFTGHTMTVGSEHLDGVAHLDALIVEFAVNLKQLDRKSVV